MKMKPEPNPMMSFEEHVKFAKDALKEVGSLRTQMVVPTTKGLEVYMLMFENDEQKREMINAMRTMVDARQIDRYIVMTEGWMGQKLNTRPSEDPERKEGLIIFEFRRNGMNKSKVIMFHRENDEIVFEDEIDMSGSDTTESYSVFNFYLEDAGDERFKQMRAEHTLKQFEDDIGDEKIKEMFELLKSIKPQAVEGKTWQDMKDTMIKMIKDGKIVARDK